VNNITVVGTIAERALVVNALNKAKPKCDVDAKLLHPYRIEFHTSDEFRAKGFILPSGKTAWGNVAGSRVLWINSTRAANHPYDAQYTVLHELTHALDADWNTAAKKGELMLLMPSVRPGTRWNGGAYANCPREIFADAFVEFEGLKSPLDDFYGDIADRDLPKLPEILFRPNAVPPPPEPDVPSVPIPPVQPSADELQAQIDQLGTALQTCQRDRDDALARIAKKDAAMKEGLAA
jgi:hypothetical protein